VRVLVVNAGSSSLKVRLLDAEDALVAQLDLPAPKAGEDDSALVAELAALGPVDAVGHRVVHGGERFQHAVRVDDAVIAELRGLTELAPLHQPGSLAGLDFALRALPGTPNVACFDTAFHATIPPAAHTYALPASWRARWPLRRYGFHGLSHAHAARRAAELLGRDDLRVVSCHVGAGASLAAVHAGTSVDTTMGFTPLAGLVMNTRPGTVDPGLVLWLLEHGHVPLPELGDVLEHHAGLKGLSDTSGDLREVLAGRARGDGACALAFDVYVHRLVREAAAMTAATGGLDLLVLTGGVGEHSCEVRTALADGLAHLGVAVDDQRNRSATGDADISATTAAVRTVVVTAREDLEIRRQVLAVLGRSPA
jgi:acetate kinase